MTNCRGVLISLALLLIGAGPARAVELKVSRAALQRTLQQQLFSGPAGRYYLKGSARSPCYVFAEAPELRFEHDRIVVRMRTHARIGTAVGSACIGLALGPVSEVSVEPEGDGESVGFRNARLEHITEQRELNFILSPFLSRQVPRSMRVNAAELLKKALEGSTVSSGYKVTLDKLKIHSIQISGDNLIIDADGDLTVQ